VNGEDAGDKAGDASKEKAADEKKADEKKAEEKKAKKPVKKTIPAWATVVAKAKGDGKKVENVAGDMVSIVVRALETLIEEEGRETISALLLKKEVKEMCPNWPKMTFKRAIAKAVEKDRIRPIKGSFKLVKNPKPKVDKAAAKATAKATGKDKKAAAAKADKLDDLLGSIFTWVCEPKEASISLIKKYIDAHHSKLNTEGKMFKKAIETGLEKGQLDRMSGQGMSGTLQLVDGAKKTGTNFEDAIEDAIIACNEPKDASFPALKHYLSEYHTEYNIAKRPKILLHCLERCEAKGWVKRISGIGMSGSFRLAVPYRPNPKELWGEWYEEEAPPKSPKKKRVIVEESEDEEESESEEEESSSEEEEEEVIPKSKKRGAPVPRKSAAPPKKKLKVPPPPKKKAAPAKKTPAKKTPAKKTPAKKTPAKKTPAKKTPAKKTPAKETPSKLVYAKKSPPKKQKAPAKRGRR